jgi:SAP domain
MDISEDGTVSGSVNRAELAAAYAEATDETVKANLAAVGAEHGMSVEDGSLVDPSAAPPEPEPEAEEAEAEESDTEAEAEPAEAGGRYDSWSKAELQDELTARGLAQTGNKDELVARLEEDDGS